MFAAKPKPPKPSRSARIANAAGNIVQAQAGAVRVMTHAMGGGFTAGGRMIARGSEFVGGVTGCAAGYRAAGGGLDGIGPCMLTAQATVTASVACGLGAGAGVSAVASPVAGVPAGVVAGGVCGAAAQSAVTSVIRR